MLHITRLIYIYMHIYIYKWIRIYIYIFKAFIYKELNSSLLWWLSIHYKCMGLFLGSLFYSIGLYICFYAGIILFWLWSFGNKIWCHFQHTFIAYVVTWQNNTKVGDLSLHSWSSQSLGHGKVKRILQPSIRGTMKEAVSENKRLWLPTNEHLIKNGAGKIC